MTVAELAYVLGVSRMTIYNRQKSGDLPEGAPLQVAEQAIQQAQDSVDAMRERLSQVRYSAVKV